VSALEVGKAYWLGNRTFICAAILRKNARGLIIEGDGLHTRTIRASETLAPVLYKGDEYPARKLRGHLRRMTAQTERAQDFKNLILEIGK